MRKLTKNYYVVGKNPEFRKLWLAILVSRTGDTFTMIALSWLVLDKAGPAELGVLLLCFSLPRLIGGPLAGRLIDRVQAGVLLGLDNLVRCALIALVPVLIWSDGLEMVHLYVIGVLSALLSSLTEVSEQAVIPRLVEDDELESAYSLMSVNWEFAYVVGPALAGFVVGSAGASWALVIDAISFAVTSGVAFSLRPTTLPDSEPPNEDRPKPKRALFGFGVLARNAPVLVLTLGSVGFLLLTGISEVLFAVYSKEWLQVGAVGFGLLVATTGVSAMVGLLLGAPRLRALRPSTRMMVVLGGGAPAFAILAFTKYLWVAVAALAIAYLIWGPYYALERALVQRLVSDRVRGQISGARMSLTSTAFSAGTALGGLMLVHFSVPTVVLLMAATYALLGLLPLAVPSLRSLDTNEPISSGTAV